MRKNNKRILLTGGHAATTAISVVEELIRRGLGEDIFWIGSKYALEGKKSKTLESLAFPSMGIKSFPIVAGRIQRRFTLWTIPSLLKIPFGFFHAIYLLIKIRPKVTLSFGGFAAFPVVVCSFFLGIPVIIHEQTSAVGLSNKLSKYFAKKILLARDKSSKYFKSSKTEVVGNPVLTQITEVEVKERLSDTPVIFITSGSRGSEIINKVVYDALEELLKDYKVIHLTGEADYEKFAWRKDSFSDDLKKRYEVYPWVDPLKIDGLYREADIIVARAGANTVSEIMIVKRPSLLIPIPWSYMDEQRKNALEAETFGIVDILEQGELNKERLIKEINQIRTNWNEIVDEVKDKKTIDFTASKKVVDSVELFLK